MVELLFEGLHVPGRLIPDYRQHMQARPAYGSHGEISVVFPRSWMDKNDERALTLRFVLHRVLFGDGYSTLLPDYFDAMDRSSGVMISCFVQMDELLPGVRFPGDIDLLIIPYQGNELVLSMTLAVEVKAVRASYRNQGKSPNQYGFSQACAMLEAGFPHVAVAHLITSDASPVTAWREIAETRFIDPVAGTCEEPWPVVCDMMPVDLIRRSVGRLEANCPDKSLGLLAAYLGDDDSRSRWLADGKQALFNHGARQTVMDAVADYFHRYPSRFLDTPRYPPA